MTNRLDETLRFHQTALNARAYRQQVIASNIANADTPNFKARDLDFSAVLAEQAQQRESGMRMQRTHEQHFALEGVELADPALRFRSQMQALGFTVLGGGHPISPVLLGDAMLAQNFSRALLEVEPELRGVLKPYGFLTRDSRVVERKKYGRAKARRSFQFSKR